ncbi:MAG: putative dithiol-disulfide isomerase involved in polyketide biosynthesis [Halonotius sp. J07HN4]|nr:MAG: putative dithiol-disulfide isomerase involved in polyketide biosynthesis [Halonotius sp. J07HN4]
MSTHAAETELTIYSDYVCPFCYLGRQSLARYQADREKPLKIDWQPFDLRSGKRNADGSIDHSVDDGKDDEYFEQARESVRRLQEKYAVEMAIDLATDVDSLNAQVASYYIKEHDDYETWLAFDKAIFAALWTEGRDIGDEDVIADIAGDVAIDTDQIRSALTDADLREEVTDAFAASQRAGVTGVPTFASDGHAARGAVPPEQLKRLVEGSA